MAVFAFFGLFFAPIAHAQHTAMPAGMSHDGAAHTPDHGAQTGAASFNSIGEPSKVIAMGAT